MNWLVEGGRIPQPFTFLSITEILSECFNHSKKRHSKPSNNYSNFSSVFHNVWQSSRKRKKLEEPKSVPCPLPKAPTPWSNFTTLSKEEWKNIWKVSQTIELKADEVLLSLGKPNECLFMVSKGSVIRNTANEESCTLTKGRMCGASSFLLEGSMSTERVIGGGEGASLRCKSRKDILDHLAANPSLLAKFFATISRNLLEEEQACQ